MEALTDNVYYSSQVLLLLKGTMCGSVIDKIIFAKFEGNQFCPLCHLPSPHPLTVRRVEDKASGGETFWLFGFTFKGWQRANRREAVRQIKQGPSQQGVLGQIGWYSVQPLNILPTERRIGQDSQAVTEEFPIYFSAAWLSSRSMLCIKPMHKVFSLFICTQCRVDQCRQSLVVFFSSSELSSFVLRESLRLDKGWVTLASRS